MNWRARPHARFLAEARDRAVSEWKLLLGDRLDGGFSGALLHLVVDASGDQLVLKVSPPDESEWLGALVGSRETQRLRATALRIWDGRGAVGVRAFDPETGAMLMPRLVPGTQLPQGDPESGARHAADLLGQLHAPDLDPAWTFPDLTAVFDLMIDFSQPVEERWEPDAIGWRYLDQMREVGMQLAETADRRVLLHGDFINKNLLLGETGYVAVDPEPMLGDPCCDVGFFAASYRPARYTRLVADLMAERLNYDPVRSARWAAVWSVNEARETWRDDTEDLVRWVQSDECAQLLLG